MSSGDSHGWPRGSQPSSWDSEGAVEGCTLGKQAGAAPAGGPQEVDSSGPGSNGRSMQSLSFSPFAAHYPGEIKSMRWAELHGGPTWQNPCLKELEPGQETPGLHRSRRKPIVQADVGAGSACLPARTVFLEFLLLTLLVE